MDEESRTYATLHAKSAKLHADYLETKRVDALKPAQKRFTNAIIADELDDVEEFLECGEIDVNNKTGFNGYTPMHRATQFGSVKMVQLLLKYGGDVRTSSNDPTSPLHCVLNRGRPLRMDRGKFSLSNQDMELIVRALLLHGADVNASGYRGKTPLHAAVYNCKSHGVVKLLLDHGAETSKTDEIGQNVLHSLANRPGASSVRNKLCRTILDYVKHDFELVLQITGEFVYVNFGHDPDDSDDSDGEGNMLTAEDLAEIYELPGLAEILHAAHMVAFAQQVEVQRSDRAKVDAKKAEDRRQRKTALAMCLHSRLGADSGISTLGADIMGIIAKNM
jgi:hypothetical protein